MTENELSGVVFGAVLKVHKALGPGLPESAYEECLFYELKKAGMQVKKQKPLPLVYEEVKPEVGYRAACCRKKTENHGQIWSEFQQLRYRANAQPLYVLIDHKENNLNPPTAYNPDIEKYYAWLKEGIENFKKK